MADPARPASGDGIRRRRRDREPSEFHRLRRDALQVVQDLSGEVWTDYNLHDPGVTILETLAYAITDLTYRTTFETEDYFTAEDGTADWSRIGLHAPEDVLTCRPTTVEDLRRALLDRIPEVDNVWVTVDPAPCGGLLRVEVRLAPEVPADEAPHVIAHVERVYRTLRNLGEDLAAVVVLPEREYALEAAVNVAVGAEPAAVLAAIYDACARHLATSVSFRTFEEALHAGTSFETLFDGPFTPHGVADAAELAAQPREEQTDLFGVVRALPGVEVVRWLNLRRVAADAAPPVEGLRVLPRLCVPQRAEEIRVRLFRGTTELPVPAAALNTHYRSLRFRRREMRHVSQDVASLTRLPAGRHRDFATLAPLTQDLPPLYGVGRFGLPPSAPREEHARALQLKAYLALFDQLLANFAASLANTRRLFSVAADEPTYFWQARDETTLPGIGDLYAEPPAMVLDEVVWDGYDRHTHIDRRSRLLDYQLALHGESLAQFSLRQFAYYQHGEEMERTVVRNKAALLEQIVSVCRDRGAGFDDSAPAWETENVSGLARRIALLLGCGAARTGACTGVFAAESLTLVTDGDFDARLAEEAPPDAPREVPPPLDAVPIVARGLVSESILRAGVARERYRIVAEGESFHLDLDTAADPSRGSQWVRLATQESVDEAVRTARALRHLLIRCNVRSENLHVVEHVLLRPLLPGSAVDADFFSFRVTVVLPGWTARFHDPEFRKLAEDAVRVSCPAHLEPTLLWLDFAAMQTFEALYRGWLEARATGTRDERLDVTASALVTFIETWTED